MKDAQTSQDLANNRALCSCDNSCSLFKEIEQLREENKALKQLVTKDALTGLCNRRHMFACLDQEYERSQRSNLPTTIALIDLDHFKDINDKYGHRAGDTVLTIVGKVIKNTIRQVDVACRYGGEEFCVIFPSTYLLTAQIVAERIRKALQDCAIKYEDQTLHITASIGLDSYIKKSGLTMNNIIENADQELYKAKEMGRNQVKAQTQTHKTSNLVSTQEKDALFNALNIKND